MSYEQYIFEKSDIINYDGGFLNRMKEATQKNIQPENLKDELPALPLVYGTSKNAGVKIFHRNFGAVQMAVFAVAEGEINGIRNVYLDDIEVLTGASVYANGVIPQDQLTRKFRNQIQIEVRSGTTDQSVLEIINNKDPKHWDKTKKGNNVALVAITIPYTGRMANLNEFPEVKIQCEGKKVKDIRFINEPVVFSNNPVLCLYDLYTNKRYGAGVPESMIDKQSFIRAANEAGRENFKCNGVIDMTKPIKSGIEDLLMSFGGSIYEYNGYLMLDINKPQAPVMHFDESNIVGSITVKQAPVFGSVNTVVGKFKDERANYDDCVVSLPLDPTSAILAEGSVNKKTFDYKLVTDKSSITTLLNYEFLKARPRRTIIYKSDTDGFVISPNDLVTITDEDTGLKNTKVKINSIKRDLTSKSLGQTSITAVEYFDDDHTGVINIPDQPVIPKPDKWDVLPPTNLSINIKAVKSSVTAALSWTASTSNDVREYFIEYRLNGSINWLEYESVTGTDITIRDMKSAEYDFRVSAQNRFGIKSDPVELLKVSMVDGKIYPRPTGLQLITGNVNKSVSESKDWLVTWDDVKANKLTAGNDEFSSGETWLDYFNYYEIKIFSNNALLRTEHVNDSNFTYKYDDAVTDGLNRNITFEVRFVSKSGSKSQQSRLIATNQQEQTPSGISVTGGISGLFISFDAPKSQDYAGCQVHVSKKTGFTPSDKTLKETLVNTNIFTAAYSQANKGRYYVRLGAFDAYGKDNINWSAEYTFTLEDLNIHIPSVDVSDLANDLKSKIGKIDLNELGVKDNKNKTSSNLAKINTEIQNRQTGDSALSRRIDSVVSISNTEKQRLTALVKRVTTAETNINGKASASSVSTLQTTVGNNTASVQDAIKSIDGVKAQRVIKTDANGVIAGIGLLSDATTQKSEVSILADKFYILGSATDKQDSSRVPFTVTGGKTYINIAMIKDASIEAAKIKSLDAETVTSGYFDAARFKSDRAYMNTANIIDAAITNAKVQNGAITNAKIGNYIQSDGYQAGKGGWHISKDGLAEFGNIKARGFIESSQIRGSVVEGALIIGTAKITVPTEADHGGAGTSAKPRFLCILNNSFDVGAPEDWDLGIIRTTAAPKMTSDSTTRVSDIVAANFKGRGKSEDSGGEWIWNNLRRYRNYNIAPSFKSTFSPTQFTMQTTSHAMHSQGRYSSIRSPDVINMSIVVYDNSGVSIGTISSGDVKVSFNNAFKTVAFPMPTALTSRTVVVNKDGYKWSIKITFAVSTNMYTSPSRYYSYLHYIQQVDATVTPVSKKFRFASETKTGIYSKGTVTMKGGASLSGSNVQVNIWGKNYTFLTRTNTLVNSFSMTDTNG